MKVIIDITEEGLKYAKMLHMCGIADGFHEAIANGIPIINGTELASLLIDMRINGDIHDTTFIIPRKNDDYNNEVIVKRYKNCDEVSRMATGTDFYEEGLNDAWECARKIFKSECATMKYIFHTAYYPEIILNNSPTEAIAKLKEYEEQQKQTEEKTDKSCDDCRFADLTAYEFPCSACSASHTFRWEARKGASE